MLKPRGQSWVRWLKGEKEHVHDENAIHGWERESIHSTIARLPLHVAYAVVVFGQAAIRQGKWKAVWLPPPTGNDKWLLFDLDQGVS